MSTLSASLPLGNSYGTQDSSRRMKGIVIVVALHAFLGYALVSGMARNGLNFIKKPLEAVVIQEVIIPPPPPPPPKEIKPPEAKAPKVEAPPPPFVPPPDVAPPATSTAPSIVSVATPPPTPAVIAPPPAPSPPAPASPKLAAIGVICPTQVRPEMPRKALLESTEGVIRAQIVIKNGVVHEVTILSGPRVFYAAVKTAIQQYKCVIDGQEVVATQEFNFKLD